MDQLLGGVQNVWSLGEFSRTEMWWNGRPVFRNSLGQLLQMDAGIQGSVVGPELGQYSLAGSWTMAHHCPASQVWTYWDGRSLQHANTVGNL